MHNNHSQRIFPVWPPVAVAQHRHARLDFDQTPFAGRLRNSSPQEKIRHGLQMAATQTTSRHEFSCYSLRSSHTLILNGDDGINIQEFFMPIFEYVCKECDHQFEALVYGSQKAECPKCQSKKLAQQLSVFAMSAKGSASSSPSMGACGSCGDPRGPGACSMPDMD